MYSDEDIRKLKDKLNRVSCNNEIIRGWLDYRDDILDTLDQHIEVPECIRTSGSIGHPAAVARTGVEHAIAAHIVYLLELDGRGEALDVKLDLELSQADKPEEPAAEPENQTTRFKAGTVFGDIAKLREQTNGFKLIAIVNDGGGLIDGQPGDILYSGMIGNVVAYYVARNVHGCERQLVAISESRALQLAEKHLNRRHLREFWPE